MESARYCFHWLTFRGDRKVDKEVIIATIVSIILGIGILAVVYLMVSIVVKDSKRKLI